MHKFAFAVDGVTMNLKFLVRGIFDITLPSHRYAHYRDGHSCDDERAGLGHRQQRLGRGEDRSDYIAGNAVNAVCGDAATIQMRCILCIQSSSCFDVLVI